MGDAKFRGSRQVPNIQAGRGVAEYGLQGAGQARVDGSPGRKRIFGPHFYLTCHMIP